MTWKQYVLQSNPNDPALLDMLKEALADLEKTNQEPHFEYAYKEDLASDLRRTIWLGEGGRALIKLMDDTTIPARYLIVEAEIPEEVDRIAAHLGRFVPIIPIEQLQRSAAQDPSRDPSAIIRLALGTVGSFDQKTFDIVQSALRHPAEQVRYAGAMAAGLLQWPKFIPALRHCNQNDPDQATRELSGRALAACEQVGKTARESND